MTVSEQHYKVAQREAFQMENITPEVRKTCTVLIN